MIMSDSPWAQQRGARWRFGYRDRSGVDVGFVAGVVGEFELEG